MPNKALGVIAELAKKSAISAAGDISWFGIHQPEEPKCVREFAEADCKAKLVKKMARRMKNSK